MRRILNFQERKEEKERSAAKSRVKEVEKKKELDVQASNQANFYACECMVLIKTILILLWCFMPIREFFNIDTLLLRLEIARTLMFEQE